MVGVGNLQDFSDIPEAKFLFPLFDLTGTGTGTWRKILRLRMTRSKMGRMFKVSQARAGIQVLLRNKVTIAGVQAYVLL